MTQTELYVVATPLGNRSDITLRAMECLKTAQVIFAEDTRETLKLLELCGIPAHGKKIHSYASHNLKRATELATTLLKEGQSIALVTDRGTPGISDPGAQLVSAARQLGVRVVPVPGVSAVATLISVSGLDPGHFAFVGFLPQEPKKRTELLQRIGSSGLNLCFYESARRIQATSEELKQLFPRGEVFFGREMTKRFEDFQWIRLEDLQVEQLSEQGEYTVLVVPGAVEHAEDWLEQVKQRASTDREWSKLVASRYKVAARDVYNALQRIRSK